MTNSNPEDLLDEARKSYLRGKYDDALRIFRKAESESRVQNQARNLIRAVIGLGDVHAIVGQKLDARAKYEEALKLASTKELRIYRAQALLNLGANLQRVDKKKSFEYLQEALLIASDEKAIRLQAGSLLALGDHYRASGDLDRAESKYHEALTLFREKEDKRGEGNAISGQARLLHKTGKWEPALAKFSEALQISRSLNDKLGEGNALHSIGELQVLLGRADEARSSFEAARDCYVADRHFQGQAHVAGSLAELDDRGGKNDSARKHLFEALQLYRLAEDKLGEANSLMGLGQIELKVGRGTEAAKAFEQAKSLYSTLRDPASEGNALHCLADLAKREGRSADATESAQAALRLHTGAHDLLGEANDLFLLAELAFSNGEHRAATEHLNVAIGIYKGLNHGLGLSGAQLKLAEVHAATGKVHEAYPLVAAAEAMCRTNGNTHGLANCAQVTARCKAIDRRFEEALTSINNAIDMYKRHEDRGSEGNSLAMRGRIQVELGKYEAARDSFRDAAICYQFVGAAKGVAQMQDAIRTASPWRSKRNRKPRLVAASLLSIVVLVAIFGFLRLGRGAAIEDFKYDQLVQGMRWLDHPKSRTTVVFVHGLFSGPGAFQAANGVFWPKMVSEDTRLGNPNVFLAQFFTSAGSESFDIPQATEEVRSQLGTSPTNGGPAPLEASDRIVFIAHSTGGIVVRDLLSRHPDLFRGKKVGLVLVASPSKGRNGPIG